MATLASLLLLAEGDEPLPDWKYDRPAFAAALRQKAAAAAHVYDGRRRRRIAQVDTAAALRAIHGLGLPAFMEGCSTSLLGAVALALAMAVGAVLLDVDLS